MKTLLGIGLAALVSATALAGDIVVQKARGEVSVRHGVTEVWTKVGAGDILKADDTMRTGEKGGAVIVAVNATDRKTITLPSEVVVDLSDIRDLTQDELMLKLTMEKVRSSNYRWKNEDLRIPNATVVHGADRSAAEGTAKPDVEFGVMQMNGTHVLFNNGFYSTCALKALEVFRRYPVLGTNFDNRMMVAEALEKANLRGEALNEYYGISKLENLSPEQKSLAQARTDRLKK